MILPEDSAERKEIPLFSGVLNYFPLAIAAVARVSKRGNDKHNPGQPLHWARGKSMDHEDCIARHLVDIETTEGGEYVHAMSLAWRALAKLQELEEKRLGKPMSRGSRDSTNEEYGRSVPSGAPSAPERPCVEAGSQEGSAGVGERDCSCSLPFIGLRHYWERTLEQ